MSLPTKTIYCQRSGLPLASVTALCSSGWPFLTSMQQNMLHPIYAMPLGGLLNKFKHHLAIADQAGWMIEEHELTEVKLCMSATMYAIDCIWQPPVEATHLWAKLVPSLPGEAMSVGAANRLYNLARWYHFGTSKRLEFPKYRISKLNGNLEWQNISAWLDDAFSIKDQWEAGRDELQHAETLRLRTDALATVHSEAVYKRVDFNKVWNWIDIQLSVNKDYPTGRRQTFKSIFMSGELHPEQWSLDDIEDVQFAVLQCCDMGNDISFFINKRLESIRQIVKDFYNGFTLLTSVGKESKGEETEAERTATAAFFAEYDRKAASLAEIPPEPRRADYGTMGQFAQAQAQWRILVRRFESQQTATANTATANSIIASL